MRRAARNTENKAVMDLFGFAKVCGILNVFRYPEGELRREMAGALRRAAQELIAELSATPDEPISSIESVQHLITMTDAVLNETHTNSQTI
jgi:hypothetical protein